jgi:hypothetical protein
MYMFLLYQCLRVALLLYGRVTRKSMYMFLLYQYLRAALLLYGRVTR